ncbi:MAG: ATP-binding cassette domain-containing protein [Alphaproteobacteria bacterium]
MAEENRLNIHSRWVPYLTTVSISTIGGAIKNGLSGGLIGLGASIIDEYLIQNDIINKHYITSYLFWASTILSPAAVSFLTIYPNLTLPIYAATCTVPAVLSYFADDFLDFNEKLNLPLDSFLTVNSLFDTKEIISWKNLKLIQNTLYENPYEGMKLILDNLSEVYNNKFLLNLISIIGYTLVKISANFTIENYFLQNFISAAFTKDLLLKLNPLSYPKGSELSLISGIFNLSKNTLKLYTIKKVIETCIDIKLNNLTQDQFNLIIEQSTELILKDGNGRKILANDQGQEIIQNLTYDLYKLIFCGSSKLVDVTEECLKSVLELYKIVTKAADALAPYAIFLIPMQMCLQYLSDKSRKITEEQAHIENQKWEIKFDISDNIENINLRDGKEFVKDKYNRVLIKENELSNQLKYYNTAKQALNDAQEIFNLIVDFGYFGGKFIFGKFDLEYIYSIKNATSQVYSFLSSNINFQLDNTEIIISKNRIDKLFEIINQPDNDKLQKDYNNDNKLIIKNYKIDFDNKEIVNAENIELSMGKNYAVTGKSGCGKTTTFIDFKEGVYEPMKTEGKISFPYVDGLSPHIMFINQDLYLPKGSTLLEVVFFPNLLNSLNEEETENLTLAVKQLFKELEIDDFINDDSNEKGLISRLDSKEFKLSGGQAKKIAIIQAVFNQPDILIMDETLTGLDKASIIKVEQVLNEYLAKCMKLIIDHHALDNNYNEFYDYGINFDEGFIKLVDIPSKFYNEIL